MTEQPMIRFLTCGHVDDGKSTLIGRLLFDMQVIPEDQLAGALVNGAIDYSRLTDGLEDERAQGITIDVAYRYFRHGNRHYRIADTPGHVQYLRNMAVAAVDSDCALLLVDAVHGVREQTIRYGKIAASFGVRHFVVAVNKMDLVAYAKGRFEEIAGQCEASLGGEGIHLTFIPVSALGGDNVSHRSTHTLWYQGPTVREYLEGFTPPPPPTGPARLPVQYVVRLSETVRGYQGTLSGSPIAVGDRLEVAATGDAVHVTALYHSGREVRQVLPGQAVTVVIGEDEDLARGSVLVSGAPMVRTDAFRSEVLWLNPQEADRESFQGILKIHHSEEMAEVNVERFEGPIGIAEVMTASPVLLDPHVHNPRTGLFLLIEPETEKVVGLGKAVADARTLRTDAFII